MTGFLKRICALVVVAFTGMTAGAQFFSTDVEGDSMALVTIACAGVRTAPGHSQELSSQVVMGTPVRLLARDGGWWHVESPEGYRGYIIANSLYRLDSLQYARWKKADRVVVAGTETVRIMDGDGYPVSDVHPGSLLEVTGRGNGVYFVRTPDGRKGRIARDTVRKLRDFDTHETDIPAMIERGRRLMGESYLWGGTTTAAMDCSGLAKVLYQGEGVILRRDASEQFVTGERLGTDYKEYEPGDLVFFKSATTGNIVHVGIYIGDGLYLHSSGRVKINSLDPDSPRYISSNILAGASRIKGKEDTPGITRLSSHPWYR